MICSWLATFHQLLQRRRFSSFGRHVPERRLGLLFTGNGRDYPRDTLPHAHTLVPNVVALDKIIAPAGPGEDDGAEDGCDPDVGQIGGEVRGSSGGLRDYAVQEDASVAMTIATTMNTRITATSTPSTFSRVL